MGVVLISRRVCGRVGASGETGTLGHKAGHK